MELRHWETLPAHLPELFDRLRELPAPTELLVRFSIGTEGRYQVEVPGCRLVLQGTLRVEPGVDRFGLVIPGWGPQDFAWFSRRKGRGRTDYWQGAVEHHPEGRPALVLYFTAPLDGLEIRVATGGAP